MRDRRPLALQVRESILDLMRHDALKPGQQLPAEVELAERFEVGRSTIREALKALEEQGLIDVHRGRGRFVSATSALRVQRPITRFESVTEMMQGLGYAVTNQVLTVKEALASPEDAAFLGIAALAPIVRLERLRLGGSVPLIYSVNVIDRTALSGPVDELSWSGSAVHLLETNGHRIVSSAARISAARLPKEARHHFDVDRDAPWLLIVETCVTDAGRPVLLAWDYHRSDTFTFDVLRRREPGARPSLGAAVAISR